MKTLDEVIAMVEHCSLPMPNSICATCPSKQRASDCHLYTDVLHYLKVLKDILDPLKVKKITHEITCPQCNSVIAILLPELNDPLTWDELKTMEGKPVFVEERYRNGDLKSSGWWLVDFWNDDQICMRDSAGNPWNEHRSNYGRDWQAYRMERE